MMKKSISLHKEKLEDWQQELMDNKYIQGAIQMAAEEAAEEAFNEGLIEGRTEERKFLIQQLLNQGFTRQQILKLLDLDSDFPFES
jgi:predicted transposase/invertase (TIGR01784 family)